MKEIVLTFCPIYRVTSRSEGESPLTSSSHALASGALTLSRLLFRHTSVPDAVHYSAWESQEEYGAHPRKPATKSETFDFSKKPSFIWGWAYEADEVAKCIRDGKTESDVMPLRETILMMQVFDEIRKQNGLVYPKDIESLDL